MDIASMLVLYTFCLNLFYTDTEFPAHNLNFFFVSYSSQHLLHLFPASRQFQWHGFAPQPQSNERHPPSNSSANSSNPWPRSANDPTPWPFVVCKMPDGNCVLFLNVRQEGSLVVYFEVEDSVLVWEAEAGGIDSRVLSCCGWGKRKTVERGKHGEFELYDIACGGSEGYPFVPGVFGELNLVGLRFC